MSYEKGKRTLCDGERQSGEHRREREHGVHNLVFCEPTLIGTRRGRRERDRGTSMESIVSSIVNRRLIGIFAR